MPELHEQRRNPQSGEIREWNGGMWAPVAAPPQAPGVVRSAIDSLHDFVTNPDFRSGFTKHMLTEEPAALGALTTGAAMATGGAGVIGPAAVDAVAAGAPLAADAFTRLARFFAGKDQHPITAGEIVEDAAGPALAKAGPVLSRVASKVAESPLAQKAISAVAGGTAGHVLGIPYELGSVGGAYAGEKYGPPIIKAAAEAAAPVLERARPSLVTRMHEMIAPLEETLIAPAHDDLVATGARKFAAGKARQAAAAKASGLSSDLQEVPTDAPSFEDLFRDEQPVRPRGDSSLVPRAEPTADLPPEFHAVGAPEAPQTTLDQAVSSITGNDGMAMPYSDWANQIDDIVNQTSAHDLAQHPAQAGLRTKAWRDYVTKKSAGQPPYRDVTDQYR